MGEVAGLGGYSGPYFGGKSVRVGRIELPPDAWEAPVLPLNYTRYCKQTHDILKKYKLEQLPYAKERYHLLDPDLPLLQIG